MSKKHTPNILIFYSNPIDTGHLRMGAEHKAIDQVLKNMGLGSAEIDRVHATSVEDIVNALGEKEYDIIQFSGHGSNEGIVIEGWQVDGKVTVPASILAEIIQPRCRNLTAAIFVTCFSSKSIPDLIDIAPYLITLSGEGNDKKAIDFVKAFYESYLKHGYISRAFQDGQQLIEFHEGPGELNTVLTRSGLEKNIDRNLIEVFPSSSKYDSILVDISEVEKQIETLQIDKDKFLTMLSRKIKTHKWVFNTPRERGLLPVGPYFGIFSWNNPNDPVVCHEILKVKNEIDEQTFELCLDILISYNDQYVNGYRSVYDPQTVVREEIIKDAIDSYWGIYEYFFLDGEHAEILKEVVFEQFRATKAMIKVNLQKCDSKFQSRDMDSTVRFLETILSSLHDLINALIEEIAE